MHPRLPIIYVRGFAGPTPGIDRAVDDPFYGFNEGAVHVRVAGDTRPHFYQFESPLLRLMTDEGYRLLVRGSQQALLLNAPAKSLDEATIWVHRFYDASASTLGHRPTPFVLEEAAEDLFELVKLVKDKTGAERVHLVAHSMGGLVCRCLIQRVIPEQGERAVDHVDRLFTYGTPHGGIEFEVGFGLLEGLRDTLDVAGGEIFGPDRMHTYLTPDLPEAPRGQRPDGWDPADIPEEAFPNERVFCLVGTNPTDYSAGLGLSSKFVGARSDGLVQIDNAYVPRAPRAFVHRSHGGRYGMVNSEEGYQNLRRFLFGDLQVKVDLAHVRLPEAGQEIVWQLETQVAIRGLPILMHEQTTAHHCPIQIGQPRTEDTPDTPIPLLTTFLSSREAMANGAKRIRYALHLRLLSLREQGGIFGFFDHLEQTADFDDTLILEFEPGDGAGAFPRGWAVWNSALPGAIRDWKPAEEHRLDDSEPALGLWSGLVPVPPTARALFGDRAEVQLLVTPRR